MAVGIVAGATACEPVAEEKKAPAPSSTTVAEETPEAPAEELPVEAPPAEEQPVQEQAVEEPVVQERVVEQPPAPAPSSTTQAPVAAPQPAAGGGAYFANCSEARAAGAAPMYKGQPGYREGLDRDHDGIACE